MTAFNIIIAILMLAVLIVLILGVANILRTDGNAAARSNKLMTLRVALQGFIILVLGLMFFASS